MSEALALNLAMVLDSINLSKENLLRGNPDHIKKYPGFVTARCLSYHQALLPLVDELNSMRRVDNLAHYEFLLYTVPKGKRFAKWSKPEVIDEIETIALHYGVSTEVARDYHSLLSAEQVAQIIAFHDRGGEGKKQKVK